MKLIDEETLTNMTLPEAQKRLSKNKQVGTLLIITKLILILTIFLPFFLLWVLCWIVEKIYETLDKWGEAGFRFVEDTRITKAIQEERHTASANRRALESRIFELTGERVGEDLKHHNAKMEIRQRQHSLQQPKEEVE